MKILLFLQVLSICFYTCEYSCILRLHVALYKNIYLKPNFQISINSENNRTSKSTCPVCTTQVLSRYNMNCYLHKRPNLRLKKQVFFSLFRATNLLFCVVQNYQYLFRENVHTYRPQKYLSRHPKLDLLNVFEITDSMSPGFKTTLSMTMRAFNQYKI